MIDFKVKSSLLIALLLAGCTSGTKRAGDRQLKAHEVPDFVREKGKEFQHPDYFEKRDTDGRSIYEIKSADVSISLTKTGELIEREEDISFRHIPPAVRNKISSYLTKNYPGFKITEVEKRTIPEGELFDIEIRHHSSPSGYWELSFTLDGGEYVSKEVEDYETPMTLN